MPGIEVAAPAKVNLTLHVTGQRADGYHLLDSLVAFAPVADLLHLAPAPEMGLRVTGPEAAGVPEDGRNLVMKAASLLIERLGPVPGAALWLDKHLPAASGIGGGSADAAAAVRGLLRLWRVDRPEWLEGAMLSLGADVPMCLECRPTRVRGIGERIAPVALPALPAVLVNPRAEVSTPAVFRALARRDNPPMPADLPQFGAAGALIDWLAMQRNDLEAPALSVAPVIGEVLSALEAQLGCLLARMSGSGATCFGLFPDEDAAGKAALSIREAKPDWWTHPTTLG